MRSRLLHNGLYAVQMMLGLAFQVLFARNFGAAESADIFFAVTMLVGFMAMAFGFLSELFMPYYTDLKVRDPSDAHAFYRAVFTISVCIGVAFLLLSVLGLRPLTVLFAPGFDEAKRQAMMSFALVLMLTLCINPLIVLNTALLNAEHRFALPFVLGIVIPLFNVATVLYYGAGHGLTPYALAPLLGGLVVLLVQQIYLARDCGIRVRPAFRHPQLWSLARKSFSMRWANQIYALRDPLTLTFISHLPDGSFSLYVYAQKIIVTVTAMASSPILQVYAATVARGLSLGDVDGLRSSLRSFRRRLAGLLATAFTLAALAVPPLLLLLYGSQFNEAQRGDIFHLFLLMMPLYVVGAMDQVYSTIVIASKRSFSVMKFNIIFVTTYAAILFVASQWNLGLQSIPIALVIAQVGNLLFYRAAVHRLFRDGIPRAPAG